MSELPDIEVLATGGLCTVQDLGRPGHAAVGVSRSGAFDRAALMLANRLVGNAEGAAALEVTLGGLVVRLRRACTVALTGAVCEGLDAAAAVSLAAGTVLGLSRPASGLRSYLAFRGGLDCPPVLGSRSTDTLGRLGPPTVGAGTTLSLGSPPRPVPGAVGWPATHPATVAVDPGPRTDWFDGDVLAALAGAVWTVRSDSDRVGVRLDGPRLTRTRDDELPSEPTLPGAIQVPADGRPIVFGPDGPVTGGYPVIAVVRDLDQLAQLRPGEVVRFS